MCGYFILVSRVALAWSANWESSKALQFLFFHKVQNKHKLATLYTFFLFFPTKAPCQLIVTSLTEDELKDRVSRE